MLKGELYPSDPGTVGTAWTGTDVRRALDREPLAAGAAALATHAASDVQLHGPVYSVTCRSASRCTTRGGSRTVAHRSGPGTETAAGIEVGRSGGAACTPDDRGDDVL